MTRPSFDISELHGKVQSRFPSAGTHLEENPGPAAQHALVLTPASAEEIMQYVRDDLGFDYLSNASGVDWPDGVPGISENGPRPCLEAVYHLYSIRHRLGPLVMKMRTRDRLATTQLPSMTPLFRSAEFQEREIYDLYGIQFTGHPDLRRLLMWENFADHPMRKDYSPPDDFDYEPTPHDAVAEKARAFDRAAVFETAPDFENTCLDAAPPPPGPPGEELMEVSLGPHHPSTHGVFRMNVTLDGETVVRLKPVFGYLHRNHEQIAETAPYLSAMPYTDRLDYFCSLTNNWAYALSVEKLAGLEVPERAEYIRVITAELTRILNHTCFFGFLLGDMGGWGSVLMYAFREREKILDLFEALTGSRMMGNYLRFGGCRCDLPPGWLEQAGKFVDNFPRALEEIERLTATNEILMGRTRDIGIVSSSEAITAGLSGPVLRASGVAYDVRKVDGYGVYDRFAFRIPVGEIGDCHDRFFLRFLEIRESLSILKAALREIPEGPVSNPNVKLRAFRPPKGDAYGRIEAPKGELGFYLISDGSANPYRYRVRPPSLINLTILEDMCLGTRLADVMVVLGTLDIVLGEVDR